jgi:hypothetical protein
VKLKPLSPILPGTFSGGPSGTGGPRLLTAPGVARWSICSSGALKMKVEVYV